MVPQGILSWAVHMCIRRYSFGAVGHRDEVIRFWGQKGQGHIWAHYSF